MEESVVVENSTRKTDLSLILIPSPDDPPIPNKEYQAELKAFAQAMRAQGIDFSSRSCMLESASGSGYTLGEFLLAAKSLVPVVLPAFTGLLGAWLHAKYGRKVELKYKDVQMKAGSVEEIEKLVKLIPGPQKKK